MGAQRTATQSAQERIGMRSGHCAYVRFPLIAHASQRLREQGLAGGVAKAQAGANHSGITFPPQASHAVCKPFARSRRAVQPLSLLRERSCVWWGRGGVWPSEDVPRGSTVALRSRMVFRGAGLMEKARTPKFMLQSRPDSDKIRLSSIGACLEALDAGLGL
jgi:hypothetical protein